jgi:hypothetical protein
MKTDRGSMCWSQSSDKYVAAAVANVEPYLRKKGKNLPGKKQCHSPFDSNYQPELDVSPELATEGYRYFQELIGVLRWACEMHQSIGYLVGSGATLRLPGEPSRGSPRGGCAPRVWVSQASPKTEDSFRP